MVSNRRPGPASPPAVSNDGSTPSLDTVLRLAIGHHQAGRLAEAEPLYRRALAACPEYPDTLHLLGVLAHQSGRPGDAVDLIGRAIRGRGSEPCFHNNLGNALKELNRLDEATACYRRALVLKPDYVEAHYNLGNALLALGRLDEAAACYRQALAFRPAFVEAAGNLGGILLTRGRHEEARTYFQRAITLRPDHAEAHYNLGQALLGLGRLDEAAAGFERATALKPGYLEAHFALGNRLLDRNRPDEAEACYRRVLVLRPEHAEAHFNLGNVFLGRNRPDEAAACFERAIALKPDFAEAHGNLGNARHRQRRLDEAAACSERAIALKPDHVEAYYTLGNVCHARGQIQEAVAHYERAIALKPDFTGALQNRLLALSYLDGFSAARLAAEHARCGELLMAAAGSAAPFANPREPRRRLRVGYVSGDFRRHSVSYFFEPLLFAHDRSDFEIFCYSELRASDEDEVSARLRGRADRWLMTPGLSDDEVAARIRADGVDILVDLAGHTAGSRLPVFARRPAPVQMTWLGYPNTTGLRAIDCRLVDAVTDPAGEADALATEILVRLEGGFLCYGPPEEAPEPGPPPCLESGVVTFGSFNNPAKLSESTVELWAALLRWLPGARLLLKGHMFAEPAIRDLTRERFARRGVEAGRLELLARMPQAAGHLKAYQQVDIALDPFPYNGTTTTCEALWMGVPVVTLLGDRHAGRVGASLLGGLGFGELIARDRDAYIEIAAGLAVAPGRLVRLRAGLRSRMVASRLCDVSAFARSLEACYREFWRRWCKLPPIDPAAAGICGLEISSPSVHSSSIVSGKNAHGSAH